MLSHLQSASLLMMMSAIAFTTACASTGRHWPGLAQGSAIVRHGEVVPGSREKVEALQSGSVLVVTLKSGARVEGVFRTVAPAVLTMADRADKEFSIPMSEIDRIVAPATRDRLTNGIAIGAGIGMGAALAILAAVGSQDGYVLPSAKVGAPLLLSGAGGLVGALVDRAHRREQMIYRAR